jgi:hypothetical protein
MVSEKTLKAYTEGKLDVSRCNILLECGVEPIPLPTAPRARQIYCHPPEEAEDLAANFPCFSRCGKHTVGR